MSKKILSVGVVLALVAVVFAGVAVSTASAQSMSLCQTVDALVAAGVIAPDKVASAKAAAGCSSVMSSGYTFTSDLTVGSTGAAVTALQTRLGVTPATGYFGPITKAAVMAYQTAHGIPSTGFVGPLTRASLNAAVVVTPPVGGSFPAGCTSASGFSPTTGASCSTVSSSNTLSGGAGDLTVTNTSTDVQNSLKEGESDVNVLGAKVKADGSDIKITSVKVTLNNSTSTDGTSEKLSNYLDSVAIFLGSKQIGSADVSDFTRDSGSPDVFTKTIALSNAVIKDQDDQKLYVAVTGASNIDTDDLAATWEVAVDTLRFTDGTGAVLTADLSDVDTQSFGFDNGNVDDKITLKSSSSNPDDETVMVDSNSSTDNILDLVYKLDVDNDSSDVQINTLPVRITVASAGTTTDSVEDVVDSVTVTVNGKDYDADLKTDGVENGSGTADYTVDFDDNEFVINSGDTEDVKVSLKLKDQQDNYDENTTVQASVLKADIDAETSSDNLAVTGSSAQAGAVLTLNTSAALVTNVNWSVSSAGTYIDLFFTVEAQDEDFDVLAADILDSVAGTATVTNTTGTPETSDYGILTKSSGDSVVAVGSTGFTVASGDKTTFRVRYNLSGANGTNKEVTVTSIAGTAVADDDQVSPTATLNVN